MLTIIIPTWLRFIRKRRISQHNLEDKNVEIIVSDGGSTDQTVEIVESLGVNVVLSPVKGRMGQMNYGVKMLKVMYTSFYMLIASQQPLM
jgi:cellulose synthase/poly-beta-1,6-N-acetylglucosamine synthase-like glycosyltransferase